ncbi:MAG TPA: hypothetical protein VL992_07905, partial [Tepidisphaeraceae bacterium]|nr:hypothetical protein [Tepidisphaeraceae bacterium]
CYRPPLSNGAFKAIDPCLERFHSVASTFAKCAGARHFFESASELPSDYEYVTVTGIFCFKHAKHGAVFCPFDRFEYCVCFD